MDEKSSLFPFFIRFFSTLYTGNPLCDLTNHQLCSTIQPDADETGYLLVLYKIRPSLNSRTNIIADQRGPVSIVQGTSLYGFIGFAGRYTVFAKHAIQTRPIFGNLFVKCSANTGQNNNGTDNFGKHFNASSDCRKNNVSEK